MSELPAGVQLNPLGILVFRVLQSYTVFPWPVLSTQCKRLGIEPSTMTAAQLTALVPALAAGVARFTTPLNEPLVRQDLEALLR